MAYHCHSGQPAWSQGTDLTSGGAGLERSAV